MLEPILEPLDLGINLLGGHVDLLPGEKLSEQLGIEQRLERFVEDGLAILRPRGRVMAQKSDDLALGNLVGLVAVGDGGKDVVGAGNTRPGEARRKTTRWGGPEPSRFASERSR